MKLATDERRWTGRFDAFVNEEDVRELYSIARAMDDCALGVEEGRIRRSVGRRGGDSLSDAGYQLNG